MTTTIPVLPSSSMQDTLEFYRALGFDVTHEQTKPNVYAATQRGDLHLHFMGVKHTDVARSFTTCLVIVPEVELLHATFAHALRTTYGRIPLAGIPRISRMKPGQSRFTLIDLHGNSLIFIRQDAPDDYDEGPIEQRSTSALGKALRLAARLRDFKNDDAAARKVLRAALANDAPGTAEERASAEAALAELP